MRVPISWLKEYVDFDLTPAALAEKLTMAGIAVEAVEDLSSSFAGIVAGKVLSLKPHPHADKLLLVETDWGRGCVSLVTGAQNLQPGDLVPVAPVGTRLPNGQTISAQTIAGVISEGMLCSAAELGLEKQSDGIFILEGEWPLGTPAAIALGLDDVVLELELTPNRADCLGIWGVAREVAALTGGRLHPPSASTQGVGGGIERLAAVEVWDPDLCPRYGGKVLVDIKIGPSPLWLQRRLQAAGVRPINNLVDVTNYVMLELNQPLHAFDLDRISGARLIIRRAKPGETLRTIDGSDRELPEGVVVIADPGGPVAVAGVMGGEATEVTDQTTRIFLEGAYFDRISIRRTAKALGMRTEASLRFGRGIDPGGVTAALDRAAGLAEEIGAGSVVNGTIDVAACNWEPKLIQTTIGRINDLLGTALTGEEITVYLRRLGFEVAVAEGRLTAFVPTIRQDVEEAADIAEEVARLYGYDRIPITYPASSQVGRRTPAQLFANRARRVLNGLGQTEIFTYSFCSPRLFDRLRYSAEDPARRSLRIMAPLSEEWSMMRPTLLGGVLETLSINARRGVANAAVYEEARVFIPVSGQELPSEPLHLAGGLMGETEPRFWGEKPRKLDFYDLKGLVECLLEGLGVKDAVFAAGRHPALHPGRTAAIAAPSGAILGYLGEVHPAVATAFDLRGQVYLFEFDLDQLRALVSPSLQAASPPRYPASQRDLAVLVPAALALPDLTREIEKLGGELLTGIELFDIYTGPQVGADRKSMALSLIFRAKDRTLTDREVNEAMAEITSGLKYKFGAAQR